MTIEKRIEHSDSAINSECIKQIKSIMEDISIKTQSIDLSNANSNCFMDFEMFLFDSFNKIEFLYKQLLANNIKK